MDKFEYKWQRNQERWARRQERWTRRQGSWGQKHTPAHAVFLGAIIIAIGVIFLLDNLGIVRVYDVWEYWPVILIGAGAFRIVESRSATAVTLGAIMACIGALFLLGNLDLLRLDWNVFWPVILIAWGIVMLLRPGRRYWQHEPAATPEAGSDGAPIAGAAARGPTTLNLVTIFGGGKRQVDSQDFRGGDVTAVFGGYEVDLRRAAIAADQAVIEATAIFGGVQITVPPTWTVEARGVGIFGGFVDETTPPSPGETARPQRLIVTGAGIFGGVHIITRNIRHAPDSPQ